MKLTVLLTLLVHLDIVYTATDCNDAQPLPDKERRARNYQANGELGGDPWVNDQYTGPDWFNVGDYRMPDSNTIPKLEWFGTRQPIYIEAMAWFFSSTSSADKKCAKTGENWKYQIYFDPDASSSSSSGTIIKDDELMSKLTQLVDASENIDTVYAYKIRLSEWQLTQLIFYHMFIVFKTKHWWWSIEKHSDGIKIQRSKQRSAVRDKYQHSDRLSGRRLMKQDAGGKTMRDLIEWLYETNVLNEPYDVSDNNCQHFAKAVYNYVAKTTSL